MKAKMMCLCISPRFKIRLDGLNEGQKVTYELEEQRNGKMAAVGLALVD